MEENRELNKTTNSILLIEEILKKIKNSFKNYDIHCSKSYSYIQIWKKSWDNTGKTGIHFQLTPQKGKNFAQMLGNENVSITFSVHNEANTKDIYTSIKSHTCFNKQYSFLSNALENSILELIADIKKMIDIEEEKIDNAHKNKH